MKFIFSYCLFILAGVITSNAQFLIQDSLYTNAPVRTIAKKGSTAYIGGACNQAGSRIRYAQPIDKATQEELNYIGPPNGPVRAIVEDGNGGWYIGGDFTQVAGQSRNHVAKINADGSLSSWDPGCNGIVNAIVFLNNQVFIGG